MRPKKQETTGSDDLFRAGVEQRTITGTNLPSSGAIIPQ
jgi:hypothetical protein